MKITDLDAYKRLVNMFEEKGYSQGVEDKMPIYSWDNVRVIPKNLTPGHYVHANSYGKIKFWEIPQKYRTRAFFLHTLTSCHKDIVEYVKSHMNEFDKQFFKDHIATTYYSLEFEENDFEYMPLEYIDEEMVACAMLRAIHSRYVDRRDEMDDWFYSVHRRKPEVLTQDLYILGARCFASKRGGKNKFLEITPKEYRTSEYYFALCLNNSTPVMEDVPEEVLTNNFLVSLLNDSMENIKCFSEAALERELPMAGKGMVKCWQAAIICDGYQVREIPLNDERVEFFLANYDKDSPEYAYGFKDHYKRYLRQKKGVQKPKNDALELASMATLAGAMFGMGNDEAIDFGNAMTNASTDRQCMLPIHYGLRVESEYCKKYDREEYLLEIYKKLGIQVVEEADAYYYTAILPENISVSHDEFGYWIKNSDGEELIHYYDRGPFYDRSVTVDKNNVTL